MRFDPSIVTIKKSFTVSQIVSCPVVLSLLVLFHSVNKVVPTVPLTDDYDSVAFVLS